MITIAAGGPPHEVRRTLSPCVTPAHVRRHQGFLLVTVLLFGCPRPDTSPPAQVPDAGPSAKLLTVGPRLLSNQTSQPLSITGEGLTAGMTLQLGEPLSLKLPLAVTDSRHAFARLPGGLAIGTFPEVASPAQKARRRCG